MEVSRAALPDFLLHCNHDLMTSCLLSTYNYTHYTLAHATIVGINYVYDFVDPAGKCSVTDEGRHRGLPKHAFVLKCTG